MKFCPKCGSKLAEDVKFCPGCGNAVAVAAAPEQPAQQPVYQQTPVQTADQPAAPKKKAGINWKVLTILLIIGALLIGAGAAVIVDIVDDGEFNLFGLLDSDTSTTDDDDDDEDDETDPTGTTGPAAPVVDADPKAFTVGAMTITLDTRFQQVYNTDIKASFEDEEDEIVCTVTYVGGAGGVGTVDGLASAMNTQNKNLGISSSVYVNEGITYLVFQARDTTGFKALYLSDDSYWSVEFKCKKAAYGECEPQFLKFAKSVVFAPVQKETRYCEYCKQNMVWQPWTSRDSLPAETGHFYLTDNVELTATTRIGGVTLCLDLNGKTVRQTVGGNQVYRVTGAVLNIMDSSANGSGVIYPASALNNGEEAWGQGVNICCNAELNLYGGTIDASNIAAQYSCCVHISAGSYFNMYGGKLIGGTTWGSGGTVLVAQGTFSMHAGEIIGGHAESTHAIGGGGAIRVTDTVTIYGGSVTGGSTNMDGGNIRVGEEGFLFIGKDAVVSGGQADGEGDNIFVQAGGEYVHGTGDILSGVYFENTAY